MIGRDAKFYLQEVFGGLNKTPGAIAPDVMNEYVRQFSNPDTIHSTCEDFRAAADIDLEMDRADDEVGKKIECPFHVLWGGKNAIGSVWDVLATWREKCAAPVTGKALDAVTFCRKNVLRISWRSCAISFELRRSACITNR
jgi:haloacetate dehalogenase